MLIPVYHIIASQYAVAATTAFEQGHVAALSTAGLVVKNPTANLAPIGLAADKNRPAVAAEWVNRVSDAGNETGASGLMTVYHSGGEFWVDIDDNTVETPDGTVIDGVVESTATTDPGTRLWGDDTNIGHLDSNSNGINIAIIVAASQELTTGIPGEFEPGVTFNLASSTDNKNFVKIKLLI